MRLLRIGAACVLALLAACGGGGESPAQAPWAVPVDDAPAAAAPASCAPEVQRDWLYRHMRDWYYWPDGLAAPDALAQSIGDFFKSMLHLPLDRFSNSQPAAEFTQFYAEGTHTGYGYTLVWADAARTTLRVRSVEPLSPVGLAGLRRGDQVVLIDGKSPQELAAQPLPRVTTAGVARSFSVRDATAARRDFSAQSANYALTPVSAAQVFDQPVAGGSVKVAYLAYHEFITASETGLDRAFSSFVQAGATELVLDLRYNGGGSVFMGRNVASMIGGTPLSYKLFAELRFNARQRSRDISIPFVVNNAILPGPALEGLRRVIIIASPSTASASELVINSLKPFMPVVLVGETSYGKPYGFLPRQACGVVFNAVNFESFNAAGVGGFTAGFRPDCEVPDDLDHALGDRSERRLAAALHYITHGSCPAPPQEAPLARSRALPTEVLGEPTRPQMWLD